MISVWKVLPRSINISVFTQLTPMFKRAPEPLDPIMIINAYAQGIFPMADHRGKISWYAPDPRAVLEHHNLHVSRSLHATIRKRIYDVRMDTNFEAVMRCCADREETWINESFITAYTRFHSAGLAPRVEAWKDGVLVGALSEVAFGGTFF